MKVINRSCLDTVSIGSINYGECCGIEGERKDNVYMLLKTGQPDVNIVKRDHIAQKMPNTKKLLNLATGQIRCVPSTTRVIPVNAAVCIEPN